MDPDVYLRMFLDVQTRPETQRRKRFSVSLHDRHLSYVHRAMLCLRDPGFYFILFLMTTALQNSFLIQRRWACSRSGI